MLGIFLGELASVLCPRCYFLSGDVLCAGSDKFTLLKNYCFCFCPMFYSLQAITFDMAVIVLPVENRPPVAFYTK